MEIDDKIKANILSFPLFKGTVVTGSMIPVIKIGEKIVVEVKARNIKRFDIIVFVQNKKLICHYLWNMNRFIEPRLMQTRNIGGGKDYPIGEDDYIGKVISHKLSFFRKLKIILSQ
jgi:signal peptidase I